MTSKPAELAALEQRCKILGLPLTIQRRAILEVMLARQDHPTADQIAGDLNTRFDGISRTTVYRALETFVEHGLLVRVCHPGAATRYDTRTERHHHTVCDACGQMTDFAASRLDDLELPDFRRTGFQPRDFSVYVRGLCQGCADRTDR